MVPTIAAPADFAAVVARPGTKILFDADAEPSPVARAGTMTVLVGPEGGWSDKELALARAIGCSFERLGPRRLRAETAAIVAVARFTMV